MQKKVIAVAVFFAALLVFLTHLGARATATPVFTYASEEKCVYLTFDDGPSTVVTNRILDTLKKENVKATFFIVSDRAKSRKETLLRIAEEGHTVGVHSATHRYSEIYASLQSLLQDVTACANFIHSVTGITPRVYRFPGGGFHRAKETQFLKEKGYQIVEWNASCRDEEIVNATPQRLFEETVATALGKNRVVLLMHDSAPHKATADALPLIISYFREQDFSFCSF